MSTSSKPEPSTASPWAVMTIELIDSAIQGRVLVYGRLPPDGGDIDLLARPAELRAIRETLVAAGFVPAGGMLVRFRQGKRELVELTPAYSWSLPPGELDALFTESQPIDGVQWLRWPSQHHMLLIRARKAVRRRASLQEIRRRAEIRQQDGPGAWQQAERRAAAWQAREALRMLQLGYETEGRLPWTVQLSAMVERLESREARTIWGQLRIVRDFLPTSHIPHIRKTRVVTFSGLDGSGKTSQARLLRDTLRATGQDAVVIWAGIGTNRSLVRIKSPVKRVLRALPRIGPLREVVERVTPRPDGRPSPLAEPGARIRRHGVWFNTTTQVWMLIMAIANAYSMRKVLLRSFGKGRIVIFDRYTLDSAVRLRHWYGDSLATRAAITLLHLTLKRPLRAYFLDVPSQVAFDRKPEWELHDLQCRATLYQEEFARLGVHRLDGTRPVDDLFAEIAADVWSGLR